MLFENCGFEKNVFFVFLNTSVWKVDQMSQGMNITQALKSYESHFM